MMCAVWRDDDQYTCALAPTPSSCRARGCHPSLTWRIPSGGDGRAAYLQHGSNPEAVMPWTLDLGLWSMRHEDQWPPAVLAWLDQVHDYEDGVILA